MIETPPTIILYLLVHGITTVGSIMLFFIRNEHRITKIETKLDYLERSHGLLMATGRDPDRSQ